MSLQANKSKIVSALKNSEELFKGAEDMVKDLNNYEYEEVREKAQNLNLDIKNVLSELTSAVGENSKLNDDVKYFEHECKDFMESLDIIADKCEELMDAMNEIEDISLIDKDSFPLYDEHHVKADGTTGADWYSDYFEKGTEEYEQVVEIVEEHRPAQEALDCEIGQTIWCHATQVYDEFTDLKTEIAKEIKAQSIEKDNSLQM